MPASYRSAFPTGTNHTGGLTKLEWFVTHAPEPSESYVESQRKFDSDRNPHNDSHKPPIRSRLEIIVDYKIEYAKTMLERISK